MVTFQIFSFSSVSLEGTKKFSSLRTRFGQHHPLESQSWKGLGNQRVLRAALALWPQAVTAAPHGVQGPCEGEQLAQYWQILEPGETMSHPDLNHPFPAALPFNSAFSSSRHRALPGSSRGGPMGKDLSLDPQGWSYG